MADHHHHLRHHTLVSEYVEARAVKVTDATGNAKYFLFHLLLYHLLVMELEATLAVYQENLAVLEAVEVQEAPEVVDLVDQREVQDHQRK